MIFLIRHVLCETTETTVGQILDLIPYSSVALKFIAVKQRDVTIHTKVHRAK